MRVDVIERIGERDLLDTLRGVRLRGFDGAQPYADADLRLVRAVPTDDLTPAQNYVLLDSVATVDELRAGLLPQGVDVFDLDGAVWVATPPDGERIPVLPPIVEESHEPDGRSVLLINDGMHRVFAARRAGLPITVVVARRVPREYPYYAYALPDGWAGVTPLIELPDVHQKKKYRHPSQYKALFRDFNALFPGVQKDRKSSNPAALRA